MAGPVGGKFESRRGYRFSVGASGLYIKWLVVSNRSAYSLHMSFQLQELPVKFSGVTTYGIAGIIAATVIVAMLMRRPNVSKMNKTTHSLAEF